MPKKAPVDAESDRGKKGLQRARREASGSLEDTKVFPLLGEEKKNSFVEEVSCPQASSDCTKIAELSSASFFQKEGEERWLSSPHTRAE